MRTLQHKSRFNIFWKTFVMTIIMLLSITFIAFTLIYLLLPGFYENHKIESYTTRIEQKLSHLENTNSLEEEIAILGEMLSSTSSFTLLNEAGEIVYQIIREQSISEQMSHAEGSYESHTHGMNGYPLSDVDALENANVSDIAFFTIDFASETFNLLFDYETSHDGTRQLVLTILLLSPLDEIRGVIISMYPFIVVFCILFASIISFIFSRWIAAPIKRIGQATKKMIHLEPNVIIPVHSHDEIGILSHDISYLYEQLREVIVTLEQEIRRYSDAENKKIEFLQTVSHEMKTPLASANALIEGIIYEISPYHENQKQYLGECRDFLQKTIQLTKESLNLSEQYKEPEAMYQLKDLINKISSLYGVIFMSKQLSYTEDIPEDIFIKTKIGLLNKVLSNLFSNAANYTSEKGEVKVSYEGDVLSISNTCKPLTENEINEIFKPLMTKKKHEHATGLGLFIVKQLLRQLKIGYSFEPNEDQTGMVFKLYLPSIF